MLNRWNTVLSAALIFAGASASAAQSGAMPTIDVQKNCRAAEAVLSALFGNGTGDDYKSCVSDEQEARDKLLKEWGSFSTREKGLCVQPKEYLPSYVEWQSCLEMTQDVIKMRKAASQAAGQGGKSATGRECPVVNIGDDGNIISVIAC
jgi:hypothetical protein